MKLKSTLLATALVVFATSTATVFAADDATAAKTDPAKPANSEAAKPANGEAATPAKKKVKPHSHMTEKTGMPAPDPVTGPSHKESMDKDMPMHDHTIDKH